MLTPDIQEVKNCKFVIENMKIPTTKERNIIISILDKLIAGELVERNKEVKE